MLFGELFTSRVGLKIRFILLRIVCVASLAVSIANIVHLANLLNRGQISAPNSLDITILCLVPVTFLHHIARY